MADSDSSSEPRDRLSELPDLLILAILSLLPMRDVVMTAILSKRWKYLWTKVPCMDFQNPRNSNLDKFRNFVCWALQLWNGTKIRRFSISFRFGHLISSDILDSWLYFAIEKQVEDLYLNLDSQIDYYAPRLLYSCSWIRELTLISCKLKIEQNLQWDQLKSLTIDGTQFCIKIPIDQILHGAPNLEFLSLVIRDFNEHLNVRSCSLKVLKIFRRFWPMYSLGNQSELVIWAPNLEALEVSKVMYAMLLLNVPSLTNVLLDFEDLDYCISQDSGYVLPEETLRPLFCSINHAKNVTLTDGCIKVLLEMKNKYRTPISFSNAKFLKLDASAADEVIGVIEIFPKLMMLIVQQNFESEHLYKYNDEDLALRDRSFTILNRLCRKPETKSHGFPTLQYLRTVEITWHVRDHAMILAIQIVLENARLLEKMVIRARRQTRGQFIYAWAYGKMQEVLRSSPTAEVIMIDMDDKALVLTFVIL